MRVLVSAPNRPAVVYAASDGRPMADNTTQFRWVVTIQGGLDALYRDEPEVFVAGNLLWYPVEGDNTIRVAPDVMVVFGRPKGDRGSYLQWKEGNVAPHAVFEVASAGNRPGQLTNKFKFYQDYGVEEYYLWDPEAGELNGWQRDKGKLQTIHAMHGWVSPRLNVKFELVGGDLHLYGPDGRKFATYVELVEQREKERQAKDEAQARAERLAAQLRALGVEPEA